MPQAATRFTTGFPPRWPLANCAPRSRLMRRAPARCAPPTSRIATQDDEESVRILLSELELAATIGPLSLPGDYGVLLAEMTIERFVSLAEDWSIERDTIALLQQIAREKSLADQIRKQSEPE